MSYGHKSFAVHDAPPAREPLPGKVKRFHPAAAEGPEECDCCGNDTEPQHLYVSEDGADRVCGMCRTGRCGCDEGDH